MQAIHDIPLSAFLTDLQTTTPLNNVQLSKLLLSCSSFKSEFYKQGGKKPHLHFLQSGEVSQQHDILLNINEPKQ